MVQASCRPERLAQVRTVMVNQAANLDGAAADVAPTLVSAVLEHAPTASGLAAAIDAYAAECRGLGRFVGAIGDVFAELDQVAGDQLATARDDDVLPKLLTEHPPPDHGDRADEGARAAEEFLDQVTLEDGKVPPSAYQHLDEALVREIQEQCRDGVWAAAFLQGVGPSAMTTLTWLDEASARKLLSSASFSGGLPPGFEAQVVDNLDIIHLPVLTDNPTNAPMSDAFLRAAVDKAMPTVVTGGTLTPRTDVESMGLDPELQDLNRLFSGPEDGTPYLFSGVSPHYYDTVNPNVISLLGNVAATSPTVSAEVVAEHARTLALLDRTTYFDGYPDIESTGLPSEIGRIITAATGPEARMADPTKATDAADAILSEVAGVSFSISRDLADVVADTYADNMDVVTDGVIRFEDLPGGLDQQEVNSIMEQLLRHDDASTLDDPAGVLTIATGLAARRLTSQSGGFPPPTSGPGLDKAGGLLGTYADAAGDLAVELRREEIDAATDEVAKELEAAARHDGVVGGLSYVTGVAGTVVGLIPSPWTTGAGMVLGLGSGAISQFAGSDEVNTYVDTDLSETIAGVEASNIQGLGDLRQMVVDAQLDHALEHPDAPGSQAFLDAIRAYERQTGVAVLAQDAQGQPTGLLDPATIEDATRSEDLQRALADLATQEGTLYDGTNPLFDRLANQYDLVIK